MVALNLTVVALLGIVVMVVLLLLGMNVGVAMMLVGVVGIAIVTGKPESAISRLGTVPFTTASNYSYIVIPLYVLMGEFTLQSGMSQGLYSACSKWFGHMRGGLNIATIVANGIFGAICGSSSAAVATMGRLSLPETRKYGYDDDFSAATCAAGGTLSWLIPPSTGFIVYALTAGNLSIGRLFAAGIVPGIILMLAYMVASSVVCRVKPEIAPRGAKTTAKEKLQGAVGIIPIVVLFVVVLGGIFTGIFSHTEAAAIGAAIAIIYTIIRRRLTWKIFWERCLSALRSSIMVFQIMIGAAVFGYFLTATKLPMNLANAIKESGLNRILIMFLMLVMYIIIGMFMDTLSVVLLTIPIFAPIVTSLGYDLIWFGVVIVLVMVLGTITPPIGINLFIASAIDKKVTISGVMRNVVPYCIALVIVTILAILVPAISLWLPNMIYGA